MRSDRGDRACDFLGQRQIAVRGEKDDRQDRSKSRHASLASTLSLPLRFPLVKGESAGACERPSFIAHQQVRGS
jgi:hypothetical protein